MTMKGVFCYRNLNRKGVVWSVRSNKTGRVVARSKFVMIENATLKVSKAGQRRVRREKRKNVHAGVSGTWVRGRFVQHCRDWRGNESIFNEDGTVALWVRLTYNPYKNNTFVSQSTGLPVYGAERIILDENGAWGLNVRYA
jgi:hypothetical protein